jgi:hypothetical protein
MTTNEAYNSVIDNLTVFRTQLIELVRFYNNEDPTILQMPECIWYLKICEEINEGDCKLSLEEKEQFLTIQTALVSGYQKHSKK